MVVGFGWLILMKLLAPTEQPREPIALDLHVTVDEYGQPVISIKGGED